MGRYENLIKQINKSKSQLFVYLFSRRISIGYYDIGLSTALSKVKLQKWVDFTETLCLKVTVASALVSDAA